MLLYNSLKDNNNYIIQVIVSFLFIIQWIIHLFYYTTTTIKTNNKILISPLCDPG